MTDHPLTVVMCYDMSDEDSVVESMRAAYDLAIQRMSLWVEWNGHQYVSHDHELGCQSNFSQMIADFKDDNNTFYKETLDFVQLSSDITYDGFDEELLKKTSN